MCTHTHIHSCLRTSSQYHSVFHYTKFKYFGKKQSQLFLRDILSTIDNIWKMFFWLKIHLFHNRYHFLSWDVPKYYGMEEPWWQCGYKVNAQSFLFHFLLHIDFCHLGRLSTSQPLALWCWYLSRFWDWVLMWECQGNGRAGGGGWRIGEERQC